jgi:uncharacterized protein HemX
MRAPAVLLNVVIAFTVGGAIGYSVATRTKAEEVARLRHEHELGLERERELRTQLEEALAARTALVQETQRLQEDLTERLRRLEEAAAKLAPQASPPVAAPELHDKRDPNGEENSGE